MPGVFLKYHNLHDRDSPSKYFWKSIFKSIARKHLKIPNLTVTWTWVDATTNLQNIFHYCSGGWCQDYELCRAVTEAQTSATPGRSAKDFWRQNQGPVTATEKDKCKFQSKEKTSEDKSGARTVHPCFLLWHYETVKVRYNKVIFFTIQFRFIMHLAQSLIFTPKTLTFFFTNSYERKWKW